MAQLFQHCLCVMTFLTVLTNLMNLAALVEMLLYKCYLGNTGVNLIDSHSTYSVSDHIRKEK